MDQCSEVIIFSPESHAGVCVSATINNNGYFEFNCKHSFSMLKLNMCVHKSVCFTINVSWILGKENTEKLLKHPICRRLSVSKYKFWHFFRFSVIERISPKQRLFYASVVLGHFNNQKWKSKLYLSIFFSSHYA